MNITFKENGKLEFENMYLKELWDTYENVFRKVSDYFEESALDPIENLSECIHQFIKSKTIEADEVIDFLVDSRSVNLNDVFSYLRYEAKEELLNACISRVRERFETIFEHSKPICLLYNKSYFSKDLELTLEFCDKDNNTHKISANEWFMGRYGRNDGE